MSNHRQPNSSIQNSTFFHLIIPQELFTLSISHANHKPKHQTYQLVLKPNLRKTKGKTKSNSLKTMQLIFFKVTNSKKKKKKLCIVTSPEWIDLPSMSKDSLLHLSHSCYLNSTLVTGLEKEHRNKVPEFKKNKKKRKNLFTDQTQIDPWTLCFTNFN